MTTSIYKRTKKFLNKAKLIHNNKYDYSLVEYKHSHTKIKIICPIHGEFTQRPSAHISGQGCKKCQYELQSKNKTYNNDDFINKAKLIHNNKYDYSLLEYKHSQLRIKIICPLHGEFTQIANNHLNGLGCKKCTKHQGFLNNTILNRNPILANKTATLYLIQHENLYKIGITTQDVFKRFNKSVKIIIQLNNITLFEAFIKEQEILEKYSQFKEKPKNWNKRYNGDSEFLNITVNQRDQIISEITAYGMAKPILLLQI